MHRLLHDIPPFLILFLEQFFIFNQMLSIRSFVRREIADVSAPAIIRGAILVVTCQVFFPLCMITCSILVVILICSVVKQ